MLIVLQSHNGILPIFLIVNTFFNKAFLWLHGYFLLLFNFSAPCIVYFLASYDKGKKEYTRNLSDYFKKFKM